MAKEGRLKRYRKRVKQYKQNRIFQNNERKFDQQDAGECRGTNQQLDAREAKQFWSKIWEQKEHNIKAALINNMEKDSKIDLRWTHIWNRSEQHTRKY